MSECPRCHSKDCDTIETTTTAHEHALDFLKKQPSSYFDGVLYDPPYSVSKYRECYPNKILKNEDYVRISDSKYQYNIKNELARITKIGGKAICCGWNSNGLSLIRGIRQTRMLSVAHAGRHHDTLVTVEIKESPTTTNNNNGQLKVPSKTLTDLLNDLSPNFEKLQSITLVFLVKLWSYV